MHMKMYKNNSDKRYINKSIQQVGNEITSLYLKDETDLINPVIILDDFPTGVNYCYLQEFDRYYYLESVQFLNGQFSTQWHVDVLMSFSADIKKQNLIIERCSYSYDNYLQDNDAKIEQYTNDRYLKFTGGNIPFNYNTTAFCLSVLGG